MRALFFLLPILSMVAQDRDSSRSIPWNFFPDTASISPLTADAHSHRTEIENILISKDIRVSMGTMIPIVNLSLFNVMMQASLGASVHFELHPVGQAQIVSNDYYVDFLTLDIPVRENLYSRMVIGHTSHHFSDNWYERLALTSSVRYSRDYLRLYTVYQNSRNSQFYLGADYAYTLTIGRRIKTPWIFHAGGTAGLAEFGKISLYTAADWKLHQEADFSATTTLQFGILLPMQTGRVLRIFLQHRSGLDERGQFFPHHRTYSAIGLSFE